MASYTTNLNLKKPAGSENVSIGDINNNMDAIDQAYGTMNGQISKMDDYTASAATAGSKFSVDSRVQLSGTVVFGALIATANATYGSSDTVAIIPTGFRPTRNTPCMYCKLNRGASSFEYTGSGSITPEGVLNEGFTSAGGQNGDVLTFLFAYTII